MKKIFFYSSLCFFAFPLFVVSQTDNGKKSDILLLSQSRYALSDTIEATFPSMGETVDSFFVDWVSPFGEILLHKLITEPCFKFLVLPSWESGFYELRVYKDDEAPILATYIVPILKSADADTIPLWENPSFPFQNLDWFHAKDKNFKGLLLTRKGKPLFKRGVIVDVRAYDLEKDIMVWSGETFTGRYGEFALSAPADTDLIYSLTFKNKRRHKKEYGYILIPPGKRDALSEDYKERCAQLARELKLKVVNRSAAERSYYYFDMRIEALRAYMSSKRFPLLGDWFVSHPFFASAMEKEKRAVGWVTSIGDGRPAFSLYPSKKFKLGRGNYRVHTLNEENTLRGTPINVNINTYESTGNIHYARGPFFANVSTAYEGAPRLFISQISSLVVLAGHNNASFVPDDREYIRKYDPIMVYFK